MNRVKVTFLAKIRAVTNNKDVEVPVGEGETIETLLSKLNERYGETFKKTLFDSEGRLNPRIIIRHNGENIVTKKGIETKVYNEDMVLIMPAIAGG